MLAVVQLRYELGTSARSRRAAASVDASEDSCGARLVRNAVCHCNKIRIVVDKVSCCPVGVHPAAVASVDAMSGVWSVDDMRGAWAWERWVGNIDRQTDG